MTVLSAHDNVPGMIGWLGTLVLAATLEIAGVAAMRNGLVHSAVLYPDRVNPGRVTDEPTFHEVHVLVSDGARLRGVPVRTGLPRCDTLTAVRLRPHDTDWVRRQSPG
jgi:hypothetical protein